MGNVYFYLFNRTGVARDVLQIRFHQLPKLLSDDLTQNLWQCKMGICQIVEFCMGIGVMIMYHLPPNHSQGSKMGNKGS